ncbi:MAG: hypothetical protein FWC65_04680, partial [Treponema sp.]|nr:hypothetical protein [Treponema sp.]
KPTAAGGYKVTVTAAADAAKQASADLTVLQYYPVTQIAGGSSHSTVLKSDGSIWAWGWNVWGVLGIGNDDAIIRMDIPVRVMPQE